MKASKKVMETNATYWKFKQDLILLIQSSTCYLETTLSLLTSLREILRKAGQHTVCDTESSLARGHEGTAHWKAYNTSISLLIKIMGVHIHTSALSNIS